MSSRRRKSEPAKKGASRAAATRVNPTARLQDLKRLEVEAYCAVLSAFRAQGELTWKKESIMQDLRDILRISEERHRMEIKRVREDEALAEIAQLNTSPVAEEGDLTDTESPRSKKKQKQSMWGSNHLGEGLPPLDAVALAASTTPPNLSHIPSVDTKSRSKRTTSTSRKRKEPPKATKKEPKVEVTTAEEEEPELQPQTQAMDKESAEEKASSGEAGGEGDGTGEAGEDGGEGEEGDGALPMEASSEDKEDLSAFGDPSEIQQMQISTFPAFFFYSICTNSISFFSPSFDFSLPFFFLSFSFSLLSSFLFFSFLFFSFFLFFFVWDVHEKLLAEKERLRAELEALQAEIGG